MKKITTIALLVLFALNGIAQSAAKVFDEVKTVTVRNVGVIKKNNVIKGYFSFYEYDKVDRKTVLYKLNIMDENLNLLGTKDIEGPKSWELVSSGFDGDNFCFKLYDPKAKSFLLKVYNQDAKEVVTSELEINYGLSSQKYKMYSQMENPEVNIIPNNGFVNYRFNDNNDGFFISYVNGTTKKKWDMTYESSGSYKIMIPSFLGGNDKMLLTFVTRVNKGMFTSSTENSLYAQNIGNGSKIFEIPTLINGKNVVPTNVSFDGEKIMIVGLNYATNNISTSTPDGLAFIELDKKGKLMHSNFKTFAESLGKYFPMDNGKMAGDYYFFIHGIERTNKNTNLIIGEKFKKQTNKGGMALTMLNQGHGGFVKLELENMLIMEVDLDGNVLQAKEIPKAKGYTPTFPSYSGFFPSYMLANVASLWGWMDYMYTLKNDDNSEISVSYLDYEKLGDDSDADGKKTHNFGQIKFKDEKISNDKVAIKNDKASFTHLYPAKSGRVLQMSYFKKEKKLSMDFIKLDGSL